MLSAVCYQIHSIPNILFKINLRLSAYCNQKVFFTVNVNYDFYKCCLMLSDLLLNLNTNITVSYRPFILYTFLQDSKFG